MASRAALAFVRRHGVVLEGARGPVPNLAEAVAGAPIRGSWWGHAKGHEIFRLTRAVRDARDVLVCRLVGGNLKGAFIRRAGELMSDARNRATIEALVRAINARDLHALDKVFTEDIVMEWPQSGERIRGGKNRREIYSWFPSLPKARRAAPPEVETIGCSRPASTTETGTRTRRSSSKCGTAGSHGRSRTGQRPFPAPDWRAPWIERM